MRNYSDTDWQKLNLIDLMNYSRFLTTLYHLTSLLHLFLVFPLLLVLRLLLLPSSMLLLLLLLLLLHILLLLFHSIRCIVSLNLNVSVFPLAEQEKPTNGPKNNYENMFQKKSSMINITFIHNPLNCMTSTMCVNNALLSVKPAHSGMPALTNQSSNSCTAFQYFTYPPRASSSIACFA